MEKEILEGLISAGLSMLDIAYTENTSQTNVAYWIKKHGLKTYHKTKRFTVAKIYKKKCLNCGKIIKGARAKVAKRKYCTVVCGLEYQDKEYIKLWLKGKKSGNTCDGVQISSYVKEWIKKRADYKCERIKNGIRCGWNEMNPFSGKIPLTVHHKDGNSSNSTPDNLEAICPNCHSLTENFGGLNRGNGRKNRYKKQRGVIP